jgi:hypothetical protein
LATRSVRRSDAWFWNVYIAKNPNGTYSAEMIQTAENVSSQDDCYEPFTSKEFTLASDLFDFISSSWYEVHEEQLSLEDWKEIAAEATHLDPVLAAKLMEFAADWYIAEE